MGGTPVPAQLWPAFSQAGQQRSSTCPARPLAVWTDDRTPLAVRALARVKLVFAPSVAARADHLAAQLRRRRFGGPLASLAVGDRAGVNRMRKHQSAVAAYPQRHAPRAVHVPLRNAVLVCARAARSALGAHDDAVFADFDRFEARALAALALDSAGAVAFTAGTVAAAIAAHLSVGGTGQQGCMRHVPAALTNRARDAPAPVAALAGWPAQRTGGQTHRQAGGDRQTQEVSQVSHPADTAASSPSRPCVLALASAHPGRCQYNRRERLDKRELSAVEGLYVRGEARSVFAQLLRADPVHRAELRQRARPPAGHVA